MKLLSIFFRKPSERNAPSITQLNAAHGCTLATGCVARLDKEREKLFREVTTLRAALADIRKQGINSKSGTARAMARKAGEALK